MVYICNARVYEGYMNELRSYSNESDLEDIKVWLKKAEKN